MSEEDRFVFKKYWISQLKKGTFTGEFMKVDEDSVYRANLIASVVSKFISADNNYAAIVLDDGSATIRAKVWRDDVIRFHGLEVGDLVNFFGTVQEYEGEVYLSPVIISHIKNPNWEIARKFELIKLRGKPIPIKQEQKVESKPAESSINVEDASESEAILSTIRKLDVGSGADIDLIIKKSGKTRDEIIPVIRELMDKGDVYEPEPNKLKVLE